MLTFGEFKQAEQKVAVKDKACLYYTKIICKSQNALNQTITRSPLFLSQKLEINFFSASEELSRAQRSAEELSQCPAALERENPSV